VTSFRVRNVKLLPEGQFGAAQLACFTATLMSIVQWTSSVLWVCINSSCWQSTRLKVQQITVIMLQAYASSMLSWGQDRDLDKMNSSALESRDHGLEIITLIKLMTSKVIAVGGCFNFKSHLQGRGHIVGRTTGHTACYIQER